MMIIGMPKMKIKKTIAKPPVKTSSRNPHIPAYHIMAGWGPAGFRYFSLASAMV